MFGASAQPRFVADVQESRWCRSSLPFFPLLRSAPLAAPAVAELVAPQIPMPRNKRACLVPSTLAAPPGSASPQPACARHDGEILEAPAAHLGARIGRSSLGSRQLRHSRRLRASADRTAAVVAASSEPFSIVADVTAVFLWALRASAEKVAVLRG